jgi:hypothetical protein
MLSEEQEEEEEEDREQEELTLPAREQEHVSFCVGRLLFS